MNAAPRSAGPVVVVMGVSGSGKSTLGQQLARALGLPFLEGDDFHPPHNVQRMAAGVPLTDADRQGWLDALAQQLRAARPAGAVLACSALKRSYRDLLRAAAPGLTLVHVHGDAALLAQRMGGRADHFMPPSLLASQVATLEPPAADERPINVDAAWPVARSLEHVVAQIAAQRGAVPTAPGSPE